MSESRISRVVVRCPFPQILYRVIRCGSAACVRKTFVACPQIGQANMFFITGMCGPFVRRAHRRQRSISQRPYSDPAPLEFELGPQPQTSSEFSTLTAERD